MYELRLQAQSKRNKAYDAKQFDIVQVAKVQVELMSASISAMEYAVMLENRNTLKAESFLIEKIDYMIAELKNAQARIKAESRYDEA